MSEVWLETLVTETPQQGYELAIKLSRIGVKYTQPSDQIRDELRSGYEKNADSLIASSHVIAVNFHTVAEANKFWRK